MNIKEIEEFFVGKTIEKPDETPKILIEHNKIDKHVEIQGKVIEAQYSVGEYYLLLITEGNPFEEALYIYYLNKDLQVKDTLELSAMYAEGMLRNLSVIDAARIRFSFFDKDEQWILEIFSSPKRIIFKNEHPVKRRVSFFNKSWLSLTKPEHDFVSAAQ